LRQCTSASAGGYQNVYFGSQQIWLDRFTDIGFIDAVARRLDFNGPFLGPESVLDQTMNFLPQQLSPGKTTTFHVASGDKITKALGLSSNEQNTFVTVTFPLELFSAGGFWMILAVGVPVIFLMLVEINFLAFSFSRNVWSISLLLTYGMLFYANTYDMFIFSEVRQIPMNFAVSMGLILFAGLLRSGTRRGAFLRPSLSQFRRSGADG